jgi:hypothetical protein
MPDFTTTLDDLSSYFLCSNDSNGARVGRKSMRGMGMGGIWRAKMGGEVGRARLFLGPS